MKNQAAIDSFHRKIEWWDWLLIWGITLAPMNLLRIGKLGPGEVLCFIWSFRYLKSFIRLKTDFFVRFWLFFLVVIVIAALFGFAFYPQESDITGIINYVFFFVISISIGIRFRKVRAVQIERIIHGLCITATAWYTILLLYSMLVSKSLFGIGLWYHGIRFAGGANNPHQVATLLVSVLFLNLGFALNQRFSVKRRIMHVLGAILCAYVTSNTKSSTAVFAIAVTSILLIYYLIVSGIKYKRQRIIILVCATVFIVFVMILLADQIIELAFEWISEDDNGMGRIEIFMSISRTLEKNWLFGLGPGVHGMGGTIEYHNTYLEILAMSGVIGLGAFCLFSYRLFKALKIVPQYVFAIVPLYLYGMAGFSARRLVFWCIIALCLSLATKTKEQVYV